MTSLLLHHAAFLEHLTPVGHPERPDRLRALHTALDNQDFAASDSRLISDRLSGRAVGPHELTHPAIHVALDRSARAHRRQPARRVIALRRRHGIFHLDNFARGSFLVQLAGAVISSFPSPIVNVPPPGLS